MSIELFTNDKEDFASDVLFYFEGTYTTRKIKEINDAEMEDASANFKKAVLRRTISFRVGRDDW